VAGALLVGVLAVAGCGGGGGDNSAAPPPPPAGGAANSGGIVGPGGTAGLVGPASRSTDKKSQFDDAQSKISPKANQKTPAQKHGVAGGAACQDGDVTPTDANSAQVNAAILCLVNGERADNNLPPLTSNPQLQQAAEGMGARMVKEQFFSHTTPDGKSVVDRVEPTGYIPDSGDWVVGENLAWGNGALATPQAIVNGWMNSPGHRANILAPDYKDIGLADAQGSPTPSQQGGTVYVNVFGAKSGADTNATLPGHGGDSGGGGGDSGGGGGDSGGGGDTATTSTTGGSQSVAGKRAACAKKARKVKNKKRRKAAASRCRKLH
jgi:uncharacterized protein YkwD